MLDQITLHLRPSFCNRWPCLRISINDDIYFDGEVSQDEIMQFEYQIQDHNSMRIEHYGKRFGENGIWDTRSDQDHIVADCGIHVVDIELHGVSIHDIVYQTPFDTDQGPQHTHYFGHNGVWQWSWPRDLYAHLIEHRFMGQRLQAPNLIMETSHSHLFDYTQDLQELAELDRLLEQHAHLFAKSS